MPKKRKTETSKEYGSFIVSVLNDVVGLMYNDGRDIKYAAGVDKTIISIFNVDEIQKDLATILERIRPASIPKWRRFIQKFITEILRLISDSQVDSGQPDPLIGIPKSQYNDLFLDLIGYEWTFTDFVVDLRGKVLALLEQIVSGNKENVARWLHDTLPKVADDPEKAVSMIRLALLIGGGDDLIQAIDCAVKELHSRLLSSPEFSAAVEVIEKPNEQDGSHSDIKFREALNRLTPKVMKRIRMQGRYFPRLEVPPFGIPNDVSSEEMFVMERVLAELISRVTENPFQLISDTWEGKLTNSLVIAGVNDVRDEIRGQIADKRGFNETKVLDEDRPDVSASPVFGPRLEDPLDELIKIEEKEQFFKLLSPVERKIYQPLIEGYNQKIIAAMFNKSHGWVSNKQNIIKKKREQYRTERRD
ncbi:hypothetical protein ACFLXY_10255 [Chloroflexota bacterium]